MNTTYRERIESTLVETHREGIDSVVEWLGENHFYDAPASVTHHNAFQGGLAKHSWEVYCQAMALRQASDHREAMAPESVAIAALLHDVCKADNYQFDSSNPYRIHPLNDNRAKGHGERSVRILERLGLAMSHEERMAIHWHMGEFELSSGGSEQDYEESVRIPLCNLVRRADGYAAWRNTWDAGAWRAYFEERKNQGDTRGPRRQVYASTLMLVKRGRYHTASGGLVELGRIINPQAQADNVFVDREITLRPSLERNSGEVRIAVVNDDCLALARRLHATDPTDDICVLNMASSRNPGGGVWGGAGAQEEYLFRCTDYYRFLYQYANNFDPQVYHVQRNAHHRYPLAPLYGGIYSHGVTVFRDTEANGYALLDSPVRLNFVAVAAFHFNERCDAIPQPYVEPTKDKIRLMLRLAANNGQRRLVLGAFGCGAFHNEPHHMAQLFRQVIHESEFQGLFTSISFAVIEDHNSTNNYTAFRDVLEG